MTGLAAGETVQSVTVGLDGYTFYDGGTVDFAGTAEPVFSAADVNAAVRVLPGVSASGDRPDIWSASFRSTSAAGLRGWT